MSNCFKTLLVLWLAVHCAAVAAAQQTPTDLFSPDKKIRVRFQTGLDDGKASTAGQLYYSVSFNGKWLLKPSAMSLDIKGAALLGASVKIIDTKTSAAAQTYQLVVGKTRDVKEQYNALSLELQETAAPQRKLTIEARAYNDAVAFRYIVPAQGNGADSFYVKKISKKQK